ncbi:hypothetical protein EC991_009510 [Linnemannia zychae]|nr:hypothetical protein EC991_009510 [Linnemannia zychae]
MEDHDERTSLVRSDRTLSNDYNSNNGHHNNRPHPSRTTSDRDSNNNNATRRDARTVLTNVQRSIVAFQTWATEILLRNNKEAPIVIQWVQNARVARTFMLIVNAILAILAFVLMGVEMVEMAVREPILDHLLPENEMTLYIAGFTIVAGAFGIAVAYNLLVEQDDPSTEGGNGQDGSSGGGGGSNPGSRRASPSLRHPTDNMLGQSNVHSETSQQQQQQQHAKRPRLMFTKASTYLLNGNAVFLFVLLIAFTVAIAQRSVHISKMEGELHAAWVDANRHNRLLIKNFELRHQCCGYKSIKENAFPPLNPKKGEDVGPPCHLNKAYGFQLPCQGELTKDFERWQKRIRELLLVQVTVMVPLLLLVVALSVIGNSKLKERKQELEDEAQAEAVAVVPVVNGRDQPLLVDFVPHNDGMPNLIDVNSEPERVESNHRPVVQLAFP